jgi:hypothetical protein
MERGLLWLPLLAIFIWLAWAGRQEYLKVEAYKTWAKDFEKHKYDIYAVLGIQGDRLTWGTPTTTQPKNLKTISFKEIRSIQLKLDQTFYDEIPLTRPPEPQKIALIINSDLTIAFTDLAIACNWFKYLKNQSQINHIDNKQP